MTDFVAVGVGSGSVEPYIGNQCQLDGKKARHCCLLPSLVMEVCISGGDTGVSLSNKILEECCEMFLFGRLVFSH